MRGERERRGQRIAYLVETVSTSELKQLWWQIVYITIIHFPKNQVRESRTGVAGNWMVEIFASVEVCEGGKCVREVAKEPEVEGKVGGRGGNGRDGADSRARGAQSGNFLICRNACEYLLG